MTRFCVFIIVNYRHLKGTYSLIKTVYVRVSTDSCILLYFETISVFF